MSIQAKLTLRPDQVIGDVHDHLYGANLEHLGQSVYGALWAEMLRDRKFAGADIMYQGLSEGLQHQNPAFGVVVPWEPINPDYHDVLFVHDNTTFYTGKQSQRITVRNAGEVARGVKQAGLYLQGGQSYNVRLVIQGEGQAVLVQLGDTSWTIPAAPETWTTFTQTLTPSTTEPTGALSISVKGEGSLWLGCASVMPEDNLKGFRADVIAAMKEWQPTFLRWPGGNFVSAYPWEAGICDRDKRPSYLDPAWNQWEPNDVGTDEFIDLCRLVDTEPILTINMGDGSAEEAAAWVEYCNGDARAPYGKKCAENGYPEPFGVKTWFVGNEQFGNWQVGHVDAETYARKYLAFARAMRAVDPDLQLIGVGVPNDLYGHWNELVLKTAAEEMDELSVHYYSIRTEKWDEVPPPEQLYGPKIASAHEVKLMLDETLGLIAQHSDPPVPLAFDEWNTYVGAKAPSFIEDYNVADALYTGALMNACIARCDHIKMAAIFNLINVMGSYLVTPLYTWQQHPSRGNYWFSTFENPDPPAVIKAPTTLVLELLTHHRGPKGIICEVNSPTYSSAAQGNLPASEDVPVIDAAATYDPETKSVYLSVVNRDVDNVATLELEGLNHAGATIYTVKGDNPTALNTPENPQAVAIETSSWAGGDTLELLPHSFNMIVFETQ